MTIYGLIKEDKKVLLYGYKIEKPDLIFKDISEVKNKCEQAWNGDFYLAGYAPEKPAEVIKQERIAELHALLDGADYWTSKYCDGEYSAEEWAEKIATRKAWREELRKLEG